MYERLILRYSEQILYNLQITISIETIIMEVIMKKLVLAVFAMVLIFSESRAKTQIIAVQVSIKGTVMDDPYPMKRMSRPVEGVKVQLLTSQVYILTDQSKSIAPITGYLLDSAVTNAQGAFNFGSVPAGNYQLKFVHPDFTSKQISLSTSRDTSLSVALLAKGAKATVAGTVNTPCSVYMNCLMQPVEGCTVTVIKSVATLDNPIPYTELFTDLRAIIAPPTEIELGKVITNASGQYKFDSIPLTTNGERIYITTGKTGFIGQTVDTTIFNSTTTTVNFSLDSAKQDPKGSVTVFPQNPTTRDSLQFTLKMTEHCCATKFEKKKVSFDDTAIYLSFTYTDSMCAYVDCITGWSQTVFSSKAQKPGTFSIYRVETPYCPPDRACALLISQVYMGTITIGTPLAINSAVTGNDFDRSPIFLTSGSNATITLTKNSRVNVRAFDLTGALVANLLDGYRSAGTYQVNLNDRLPNSVAKGTLLLQISIDGVVKAAQAVILSR
jgi:hypothetical protein